MLSASELAVTDSVVDQFGYVETHVLAKEELYAGKLVAALDRQHPRDLFDVMMLLNNEGITPELIDLLVVYLASSNRPIAELIAPNLLPLQPVFDQQFHGMSLHPVTVNELENARQTMIETIRRMLTEEHKAFLLSFKRGEPEWNRIIHDQAQELPAVRWKLQNIRQIGRAQREMAFSKLEDALRD
ncbi:MAG: nucleotidyl transferase AbiEii/AbiGii toxin family protein [Gammaproteobacteria bacterium]|nr:nucleotidyl transferase AbiEii/AbiGii toxin family protein [Gammaproteobacteria bacterium]